MPIDPPSAPETDTARKGWVVVAALFMTLGIVVTARNSIGLMMPFWSKEFDWTYGFVSTAGATMMTVMALVAPGAGLLIDRFGARVIYGMGMGLIGIALIVCSFMTDKWELFAFYSIMGGIGFAVVSPSIVSSTVAQYFDTGLGLATSVATSGSTGGQLALMPLLGILVVTVGWRPSFIGIGVIILIAAFIVPWVIGERPRSERAMRAGDDGWALRATLSQLGHDRTFWLLAAGFFICGFTTAGVVKIHLIPYAVSCGFAPVESAFAYGVMSFFSMVGMITYGYLSDRLHRPYLLASIYFMRALTFILLMQITGSSTMLFLFAILFGIFDYATFPIVASLVASHIGRRIMGVTMGLIFSSHSLGGAAGTYMGGYLFDLFARYDWVWIVSIGMAGAAAIITLFIVENRTPAPDRELAVA